MNILCAVDIETTGLDPFRDEILQLAIVPLSTIDFQIPAIQALNIRIKALIPERMSPEAREITSLDQYEGLNVLDARKALKSWISENNIEKVIPVGHNYTKFDGPFLRNSQAVIYDEVFSHQELDTLIIARFANRSEFKAPRCSIRRNYSREDILQTLGNV